MSDSMTPPQLYVMSAVHTLPFLYCSNGVCHAYRGFPLFDGKVNSRPINPVHALQGYLAHKNTHPPGTLS